MKKTISLKILLLIPLIYLSSCYQESKTVDPGEITDTVTVSNPGTTAVTANIISPLNGSTGVNPNAAILITFSDLVSNAQITSNVQINGGTVPFTATGGSNRTFTITPSSALAYNTIYTVTISAALVSDAAQPINQAYSWTFTTMLASQDTGTGTGIAPVILNNSQYPASAATAVPVNLPYIEVTFSKTVNAFTNAALTINNGATLSTVSNVSGNTWRILISSQLSYNTVYTVDFNGTVTDGTNFLNQDGEDTWSFTTEAAPAGSPSGTNDSSATQAWADSITRNSTYIYFVTDERVNISTSPMRLQYDSTATYSINSAAETDWDGSGNDKIVHRIQITGLQPDTAYTYRVWIDFNNSSTVDAGETFLAGSTFSTKKALTIAANNQQNIRLLQVSDGSSFVFWEDNGDIYGQYLSTAGIPQWGTGGMAVCTEAATQSDIRILSLEGTTDILVLYQDSTVAGRLYAKRITTAGTIVRGGTAASKGTSLTNSIVRPGTVYNATIIPGVNKIAACFVNNATNAYHARVYDITNTVSFGTESIMTTNQIIDSSAGITQVYCAPSQITNNIFFTAYSDGTNLKAKSIYFDSTNLDMLLKLYEQNICSSNTDSNFGWGTVNINSVKSSSNTESFYILANNSTDIALIKIAESAMAPTTNPAVPNGGNIGDDTGTSSGLYTGSYWAEFYSFVFTGGAYGGIARVDSSLNYMLADAVNNSTVTTSLGSDYPSSGTAFLLGSGISLTLTDGVGGNLSSLDGWTIVASRDSATLWAAEINYANPVANPEMLIDAAGAVEQVILAYERNDGSNYYISSKSVNGSTGADTVAEFNVTAPFLGYDCYFPVISLADTNTAAASSWFVSWFDERTAANDFKIYSAKFTSAGALSWKILIFDTLSASPALGDLKSIYYAGVGLIPVWIEPNATDDIYYERVSSTGTY